MNSSLVMYPLLPVSACWKTTAAVSSKMSPVVGALRETWGVGGWGVGGRMRWKGEDGGGTEERIKRERMTC